MKGYVRPMVLELDDIAEGIYAASGDESTNNETNNGGNENGGNENHEQEREDECWTLTISKEQVIAHEKIAKFRLHATHPNAVHISTASTVIITFNQPVLSANFEGFDVSISGATVTLVRQSHGNAYTSLDQYDSLLELTCDDPDAMTVLSYSISCTKTPNVQGGF